MLSPLSLILLSVVGGLLLTLVELTSAMSVIWLAFDVITTTGFGRGAATLAGQLMSTGLFLVSAIAWFGVLVLAIEISNMRLQRHMSLRPLARRPKYRLFHVN